MKAYSSQTLLDVGIKSFLVHDMRRSDKWIVDYELTDGTLGELTINKSKFTDVQMVTEAGRVLHQIAKEKV